jgi:hypothetical protein
MTKRLLQSICALIFLSLSACGGGPAAPGGGNNIGSARTLSGSYVPLFISIGQNTQVAESHSYRSVVTIGRSVEISETYSQSFDLNNGFDLSAAF